MNRRRRIAVATADPVTARMPGPAIRAWHIAEALAAEHEVQLVTPLACDRTDPAFVAKSVGGAGDMAEVLQWCDVLVFQGGLLRDHPFVAASDKVLVADIYDPFHLESLEQGVGRPMAQRRADTGHLAAVLNEQLQRGDFFLCASERQRDFWMGSLAAVGRVNPDTYDEDPTLRSLLAVVPFGLPREAPRQERSALRGVVRGIGPEDHVVLWAGGVYDWFDPLTAVRAVDRVRHDVPTVRLFFMGMRHPNLHIPEMRMAGEVRALSERLGLTGSHVFFNDGWVDYDRRADFLLDADVGISTHLGHVETAYAFRTRMLDYLWAGLPIATTSGDALADLVANDELGVVVAPGDHDALATGLNELLTDPDRAAGCRKRAAETAAQFTWDAVLGPLLAFCREPRRAPDLAARPRAEQSMPRRFARLLRRLPRRH